MTKKLSVLSAVCSFRNLEDLFTLLDIKLAEIESLMSKSIDPDTDGLLDNFEYYVGLGLVAAQRFINEAISLSYLERGEAFKIGPSHHPQTTDVSAINAAANYWKHEAEWPMSLDELDNLSERDKKHMKGTLEKVISGSEGSDYHLTNLLYNLSGQKEIRLKHLLPRLNSWFSIIESKIA